MTRRAPTRFAPALLATVALGLACRLVYALVVMHGVGVAGDGLEFHTLARQLAAGQGYIEPAFLAPAHLPTADKPPLYPLVLAAPGLLGAGSVQWNRITSCLMGALLVAALGLLGRRVAGPRAGLAAAALGAVYPLFVAFDGSVRSESLYAPLIAFVLLAAYRLRERPVAGRAAVLGALIGLAALTRSEAIVLAVLAPLAAAGARRRSLAVCAVACLLVLSPWLIRNWVTLGTPALSTNVGSLVYGSNCHAAYYTDLIGTWACYPPLRATPEQNEVQVARRLAERGWHYAGRHGGRVPVVMGVRLLRTWDLWSPRAATRLDAVTGDVDLRVERAGAIAFYAVAALALAGMLLARRRRLPLPILLVPVVVVSLLSILAYGSARFRVPADVSLVILAAVTLTHRWRRA